MSWDEKIEKYQENLNEVLAGGGKEKYEKLHAKGKMSARERIERLFDDGEYTEIEMYYKSRVELGDVKKKHYPGDGIVAGFGKVHGILVYAVSQDSTISGGAGGETHINKMCRALELAIESKAPIVYLCESGGARIEEGILSLSAYSRLFRLNQKASGMIPQIAAIMGNCAGGSSYSPAMCDFIFMVKNSGQFFITGPKVIKALTGEDITMDELGGVKTHSTYSGQVHYVSSSDLNCIDDIRNLLKYICVPKIDYKNTKKVDYKRLGKEIEDIVPVYSRKSYDVRKVICRIVDDGDFSEIQKGFAKNIVCGFARLNGMSVGIVANQPDVLGGSLDCDASDKAARFIRTCDCYDIPLLVLVDVPGFYPGVKQERKGILRHGCKLLYAFAEATVPSITLVMRKAYGGAYCAMNSKDLGADYVIAWPLCEIAVMGADGAVDVIFHRNIEQSDDPEEYREMKIKKYEEKYLNPYFAASCGMVDDIVMPEETRNKIILAFQGLKGKSNTLIDKKHGNIAL